jgi:hypothetical protein
MINFKWIGIGVLGLACVWAGFSFTSCGDHKAVAAAMVQDNKTDATATAALNKGVSSAKAAQAQEPTIQAAHSKVDADRARLQMDEARSARPIRIPAPAGSHGPDPQPVPPPLESPVEQDKDQLIHDLTKENAALRAQNTDLQAAVASLKPAATGFQQESVSLRQSVSTLQGDKRAWAAGVVYGTSQTLGAFVERDLGPFRAGVDVVRRVLPAGNATIDATARVGWSF